MQEERDFFFESKTLDFRFSYLDPIVDPMSRPVRVEDIYGNRHTAKYGIAPRSLNLFFTSRIFIDDLKRVEKIVDLGLWGTSHYRDGGLISLARTYGKELEGFIPHCEELSELLSSLHQGVSDLSEDGLVTKLERTIELFNILREGVGDLTPIPTSIEISVKDKDLVPMKIDQNSFILPAFGDPYCFDTFLPDIIENFEEGTLMAVEWVSRNLIEICENILRGHYPQPDILMTPYMVSYRYFPRLILTSEDIVGKIRYLWRDRLNWSDNETEVLESRHIEKYDLEEQIVYYLDDKKGGEELMRQVNRGLNHMIDTHGSLPLRTLFSFNTDTEFIQRVSRDVEISMEGSFLTPDGKTLYKIITRRRSYDDML